MDAISNNIANINTTGFRKQQPNFQAVMNSRGGFAEGLSGTALNAITNVHTQGSMKTTGSFSYLALQGEGFFSLQTQTGEIVYSRAGHFLQDSNGNLVDPAGNFLLSTSGSPVNVPPTATKAQITALGQLEVAYDDIVGLQQIDQIQLVSFTNPAGLERIGGNNFTESVASGVPNFSAAGNSATATQDTVVVSGALELANTNLSESLTDMMAYQRSYQAVARTSSTSDEILQTTINLAS